MLTQIWSLLLAMFSKCKEKGCSFFKRFSTLNTKKLPLEQLEVKRPETNKQWVLAETTDKDNKNNNVVLVEVEFFQDDNDIPPPFTRMKDYTAEGEDPNLRITHFPPSNRIH